MLFRSLSLEKPLGANVIFYMGIIHPSYLKPFRNFIESITLKENKKKNRIAIFLNTSGGSVQTVEKMVEILRYHFDEIYFVVPDQAMSAGTIFCMAGDKIFMDYSSSLGPIDPQVLVNSNGEERYVPALGYLDKVEELIAKSAAKTLTPAEFAILKDQNLALLRSYEQARDLSVELLKKWLVDYKFKNWTVHRTNQEKINQEVTKEEKEERAKQIASALGDNKIWHSHGRFIGLETLQNTLRLEIDDYTTNLTLRKQIRVYNDLLTDYMNRQGKRFVLHSPLVPLS